MRPGYLLKLLEQFMKSMNYILLPIFLVPTWLYSISGWSLY